MTYFVTKSFSIPLIHNRKGGTPSILKKPKLITNEKIENSKKLLSFLAAITASTTPAAKNNADTTPHIVLAKTNEFIEPFKDVYIKSNTTPVHIESVVDESIKLECFNDIAFLLKFLFVFDIMILLVIYYQSPSSYITAEHTATGAVSVRSILGPRVTVFIPLLLASSASASSNPPSGPIIILTLV